MSYWTRNFPFRLASIASLVTASTSFVSFALLVARPTGATATIVHSFVTNRLDYCLSLYSGLPSVRLACLDRILRSVERLIGQIEHNDSVM